MIRYDEQTGEPIYIAEEKAPDNPYYSEPDESSIPHRKRKNNSTAVKGVKLVGCAFVFGAVAGGTMIGMNSVKDAIAPSTAQRIETTHSVDSNQNENAVDGSDEASGGVASSNISSIVDKVMPSVVSITCTINQPNYFGYNTQATGAGSGFILAKTDDKLMIATNNHVVADSTELTVGFIDGETAEAKIVGTDASSDLAVISVDLKNVKEETASKIKVAVLGDSNKLKVGDTVIAIGNALGYGQSVTTGVLSAKDREVSLTDGTMSLLQTDAAINPGNSGGVLINEKGEVIGINNAKLADTEVEGMGYAIPMATAESTLTDIMNVGSIKEGDMAYLGVKGKTIDQTYSSALGIPSGAYVSQVIEGSPAEKAGIHAGDVIVKVDGAETTSFEALKSKLKLKKAGTEVKITLKRANQNGDYGDKEVTVKLGKQSDYQQEAQEEQQQEQQQEQQDGQDGAYGQNPYEGFENGQDGYADPFQYFFGNGNGSDAYDYFFGQ